MEVYQSAFRKAESDSYWKNKKILANIIGCQYIKIVSKLKRTIMVLKDHALQKNWIGDKRCKPQTNRITYSAKKIRKRNIQ